MIFERYARRLVFVCAWVVLFIWAVGLTSAGVSYGFGNEKRSIKQSHKIHVGQEEIECTDCHETAAEEAPAGMPNQEICAGCHDQAEDKETITEECLFCHDGSVEDLEEIKAGSRKLVYGARKYKNLSFSHGQHKENEIECSSCHANVAEEGTIPFPAGKYMPEPEQCLECHQEKVENFSVRESCATCHAPDTFDHGIAPPSHDAAWKRSHGGTAELNVKEPHGKDCLTCHQKNDCIDCHLSEAPNDHTNFWRTRAHGFEASIDRDSCLNCHRQDTCVSCHDETAPRTHTGNWDQTHCLSCHVDTNYDPQGSCTVCHRTPAHLGRKP